MIRFRLPVLTLLAGLIVGLSMVGGVLYKIDLERVQDRLLADALARNDLRAKQLADSVAQQTVALVRLFDMALLQLRQPFVSGGLDPAGVADIILKGMPPGSVNMVFATDERGAIIYSSDPVSRGLSMADRAYFGFFANGGEDRLYVGIPFKGRLGAKNWVIPFARVIRKNGHFAGVVVVGLLPEYLSKAVGVLSLNPGDIVAVVDYDGYFFARNHNEQEALGRRTPADRPFLDPHRSDSDTFRATSSVDGTMVDFAWKRLTEWPLISVVALDERAEIGSIRTAIAATSLRVNLTLAAIMSFSLGIGGLLLWARRQQRRMERLLDEQRVMLESELVGIVKVANRAIIWANPAFEKMLGYGPGELVGASSRQNYPSEEAYVALGQAAYPILDAGKIFRVQCEHVRKDGDHIWVDLSGALLDRNKGITLWAFIDITERKALEFTLKRTNAELEQFAYVASHDMRQPLRMVTSYLSLIEKRLGPAMTAEMKEFFGFAMGGAKHMDRLIVDLLEYSRTGRSAKFVPVSVGDVVGETLVNLEVAIREAGAVVIVAADLPNVVGDPIELTRLFQNLIGNAVKYRAPDRPPRIEIGCRRQGRAWLVSIGDNGIGIAAEDQERAFAIFQRLVAPGEYEGTGIGLAVCKKIVEHHGGRIWVESTPGEGSTFYFTLPDRSPV